MKPKWNMTLHMSHRDYHLLVYRDKEMGVQLEIVTPIKKKYRDDCFCGNPKRFGKAREYFYIDGNKKCFKTEADMLAALNCEGRK